MVDISSIFLGAGFALLIALLAWGNQIRLPREEIRNLEEKCRKSFKFKKKDIEGILDKKEQYTKYQNISYRERIKILIHAVDEGRINQPEQIEALKTLNKNHEICKKLKLLYNIRFNLSVALLLLFFIFGILLVYLNNYYIVFQNYNFYLKNGMIYVITIFCVVIIINIVKIYQLEATFVDGMYVVSNILENNGEIKEKNGEF